MQIFSTELTICPKNTWFHANVKLLKFPKKRKGHKFSFLMLPAFFCYSMIWSLLSYYLLNIKSVLWIRIYFNADPDPDPAFYLYAEPDPGSQINADPCGSGSGSWSVLPSQTVEFFTYFTFAVNRLKPTCM